MTNSAYGYSTADAPRRRPDPASRLTRSGLMAILPGAVCLGFSIYVATCAVAARRLGDMEATNHFPTASDSLFEARAYAGFATLTGSCALLAVMIGSTLALTGMLLVRSRRTQANPGPLPWSIYPLMPSLAWPAILVLLGIYGLVCWGVHIQIPTRLANRIKADDFWRAQQTPRIAAAPVPAERPASETRRVRLDEIRSCAEQLLQVRNDSHQLELTLRDLCSRVILAGDIPPELMKTIIGNMHEIRESCRGLPTQQTQAVAIVSMLDKVEGQQLTDYFANGSGNRETAEIHLHQKEVLKALRARDRRKLIELLEQRQVPCDEPVTAAGDSLLMAAMETELPELVDVLLKHGAMVDSRMSNGMTLLQYALLERRSSMAKLLVSRGADVKAVLATEGKFGCKPGTTITILAIHCQDPEVLEAVLNAGADPNVVTTAHGLALDALRGTLPADSGPALEKILLAHGAKSAAVAGGSAPGRNGSMGK